jgi:hypothetical protein
MIDIPNLEVFAVQFTKLVQVLEQFEIEKEVDVDVMLQGNLATALTKAEADAFGPNTLAETLAATSTRAVQGVFSDSSSIAESVSAATRDAWI